jgi:hypothetical protein
LIEIPSGFDTAGRSAVTACGVLRLFTNAGLVALKS